MSALAGQTSPIELSNLDNAIGDQIFTVYRCKSADIPIILSAPHGGSYSFGNQRLLLKCRPDAPGVIKKGDVSTFELLTAIDTYILKRINRKCHLVAARFHRTFIDANRDNHVPSQIAYHPACNASKAIYDSYHGHIDSCIGASLDGNNHSRCLLLDIHGMRPYSDFIVVGTRNGGTCGTTGVTSANFPHMGFLWILRHILGSIVVPGNVKISRPNNPSLVS